MNWSEKPVFFVHLCTFRIGQNRANRELEKQVVVTGNYFEFAFDDSFSIQVCANSFGVSVLNILTVLSEGLYFHDLDFSCSLSFYTENIFD